MEHRLIKMLMPFRVAPGYCRGYPSLLDMLNFGQAPLPGRRPTIAATMVTIICTDGGSGTVAAERTGEDVPDV